MSDDTEPLRQPDPGQFPALSKLRWRGGKRRIPFVQQLQWSDCGAACLTMVLHYFGREARLEEARDAIGGGRDGVDALAILRGAEWYELRGRGLSVEVDDLRYLPAGAILHWEFNHFVVFEGMTRDAVTIVDPAAGRRVVPLDKVRRAFTGVALVFEPTEQFEPSARQGSRLVAYLRQLLGQRHLVGRIITTSLLLRVFALSLPILTGLVVDRVVPRSDRDLLFLVGLGLTGVVAFQFLTQLIRAHLLLQLRTNLDTRMTLGFVDYLVGLPYAFFQRRSAGDLMMRINSNATIREIVTANMLSGLLDGSMVLLYLGIIFLFSPGLGSLVLVLGGLQIVVFLVSRRRYKDLMAEHLETQARAQGYLVQLMAGIETLKASGAEHRGVEHWSNLFVDELNVSLKRGRLAAMVDATMAALQGGSPLLVLGYGALAVISGQMTLGTMLALMTLAIGFLTPLTTLVQSGLQLQLLGGYIDRIDDVLTAEPEQQPGTARRAPRLAGGIQVDRLSFRYGAQAPWVVRDVSLDIEPGSSVAIVGKSGSGKSTLANLLMGLYRPEEGRILYDGNDLRELDVRSLRRQLGIVPQHPYIFGASIRENIALVEPAASLDRVLEAARQACIDTDIAEMPMGYETIVSDGGASLSGGQRQRLALARALVHRPIMILMDEATSSLDTETERRVMHNLDRLHCTRILIAHRLSTIVTADLIVVMEDGRLVEQGSHRELLERGGVYAALIASQASLAPERAS